jgi:hypothetical protein
MTEGGKRYSAQPLANFDPKELRIHSAVPVPRESRATNEANEPGPAPFLVGRVETPGVACGRCGEQYDRNGRKELYRH